MSKTFNHEALIVALKEAFQVGSWLNFFSGVNNAVPHRFKAPPCAVLVVALRLGALPPAAAPMPVRAAGHVADLPEC